MDLVFCTHKLADGGAERVITMWAKGFVAQGNTVSIILRKSEASVSYKLPEEVKIYYLNANEDNKIIAFYNRISKLRKLLDTINPDYVITALGPWGLWAYLASIGRKRVVINTEHNTFERPKSAPMTVSIYFYKYIVNQLFPFITVLTQADKDCIGKRLKKVVVLPNPLAFAIPTIVPEKKNIVLAVGRIDAWHVKGFDILVKAWNKIARQYSDWELQIVGPGDEKSFNYLKSLTDEYLLDRKIKFMGPSSDMLSHYQEAAILVSSSRYEGLGMVIFEAMSQGCACVASDYGGRQREIIRNENEGIICETDNVDALIQGISRMIENNYYRESVQKMSIERAKYYTLDNIMCIWNSLLPIRK